MTSEYRQKTDENGNIIRPDVDETLFLIRSFLEHRNRPPTQSTVEQLQNLLYMMIDCKWKPDTKWNTPAVDVENLYITSTHRVRNFLPLPLDEGNGYLAAVTANLRKAVADMDDAILHQKFK